MPFVTAGVSIGRLEADISGTPLGRQSANNLGWTVGAGVEMVISGPWTAKLEFLHADLNGFGCDMACGNLSSNRSEREHRPGWRPYQRQREHHSRRAQFQDLEQMSTGRGRFRMPEVGMKRFIMRCALFAACMSGPAGAADLPIGPVYVERPAAVGLWNWTGFYVGANLGYAHSPGSADIMVAGVPLLSLSENMNGAVGGIQAGANWQTGDAVFGIEADVQGTSQSASSSTTVVDATGALVAAGASVTAAGADKITSFGSVRGRVGVASGRALFYATGGWAYWTWSSNLTMTGLGTASLSNFQGGGAIGGGVERRCARLVGARRIPLLAVHHHL